MFSFFQNDFFKKKQAEMPAEDKDDFVLIEPQKSEPTGSRVPYYDMSQNDLYKKLENELQLKTGNPEEPTSLNPMSVQDVPFQLNSLINAVKIVDQVWSSIQPHIRAVTKPISLDVDYDFALERSVMLETTEN